MPERKGKDIQERFRWRHLLLFIGVALIVAVWIVAVVGRAVEIDYSAGTFSSMPLLTQWGLLAVACVFLFFSFYGSRPDRVALLLPIGVILNSALAAATNFFHLPFFFDFVGTVLVTVLGGPALGLLSGALTVLMWGVYIPSFLPNSLTYVVIVVAVTLAVRKGKFTSLLNIMGLGLITGLFTGVCAWATVVFAAPYSEAVEARMLTDYFVLIHFPEKLALFLHFIITEPLSTAYALIIAALMIRYLARNLLSMFVLGKESQWVFAILNSVTDRKRPQVEREGGKHSAARVQLL